MSLSDKFNRIRLGCWTVALGLLMACPLSPPLAAAAEEFKVAFVNVAQLFDNYERTKTSEAVLEKKGKQRESELQGRVNELKKLRGSLELLNDQTREAKMREIEERSDELKRFRGNTVRDLGRERDAIAQEILKEIQAVVAEFAKAHGFSIVLDERSILYGQPGYDATSEVLALLNKRYAEKH